ncbi:hypothetical protein TrVE_jg3208 [Triparma verrucosa]|uniref:CRAL-TRIO domain-containing protein n=1 Tax=Triparma verrucosa TaxID=1606542 RepID=A0A9W6Z8B5_9STRA|nr:hypothetical protein TrVE_jg3208 [Triparma verrucosa]
MSIFLQVEGVSSGSPPVTNQQLPSPAESLLLASLKLSTAASASLISSASPESTSDFRYLRFLRGYDSDVQKASQAYEEMVQWHLENDVSAISTELRSHPILPFPYALPKFAPLVAALGSPSCLLRSFSTFDSNLNLLTSVSVGLYDLRKIVASNLQDLLITSNIYLDVYFSILLDNLSVKNNRLVQRHDLLCCTNPSIGLFQFTPSTLSLIRKIGANSKHFPESISKITSCGNNIVAVGLWKIIRPFVPKHTTEKIRVLGMDYKDILKEDCEEEALIQFECYT